MSTFKRNFFKGIIFFMIISYTFSKVMTSSEYSKSKLNIIKRNETTGSENNDEGDNKSNGKLYTGNIEWVGDSDDIKPVNEYPNDTNDVYYIDSGELFNIADSIPSSDQEVITKYTISKNKIISNLLNKKFIYQDKEGEKAERRVKRGAIEIVDKMFQSDINYNLQFIAGVVANLQSEGVSGYFEEYSNKTYIINMDEYYNYKDHYSGKHIHFEENDGDENTIGICCATWLANQSLADIAMFGLGIAQWTYPHRIIGLLEEYNNYIKSYPNECEITDDDICLAKDNTKNKLSLPEVFEIESNFFMKEIENEKIINKSYNYKGFKYIYEKWVNGTMECTYHYPVYYGSNISNAAMYFCMEFENPGDRKSVV